ncbi:MAG: hypothetical protein V3V13_09105 [Paracoccaceae bacterium]
MEAFFSKDVLAGLEMARMQDAMKKNRLRVHVGGAIYPIYKMWDDGFSMMAETAPHLRGFVDLFEGSRHLLQCLVIHSEADGYVVNYEFKRSTIAKDEAPKDYFVDENAPVALIEGSG